MHYSHTVYSGIWFCAFHYILYTYASNSGTLIVIIYILHDICYAILLYLLCSALLNIEQLTNYQLSLFQLSTVW